MRWRIALASSRWRPTPGFLKSLSDSQITELRDELKAKSLVWGAAGLPIDFRGSATNFQSGLKPLADDARALQACRSLADGHMDHARAQ